MRPACLCRAAGFAAALVALVSQASAAPAGPQTPAANDETAAPRPVIIRGLVEDPEQLLAQGREPLVAQGRRSRPERRRRFDDDWGRWDDFNWTLLQMQRESISSQEEMNREAARQIRRQELEAERRNSTEEREAFFDAVLEASRASLRAPAGAYYRKPGWTSAEPPGPGAQRVSAGGLTYLYDQGVFWLPQGAQYIVVTAPPGAVVAAPPPAAYPVMAGETELLYSFGAFYRKVPAGYEVVKPGAGTLVSYVPDGYTVEQAGGAAVYRFGEILFKPVFVQGVLLYAVAER